MTCLRHRARSPQTLHDMAGEGPDLSGTEGAAQENLTGMMEDSQHT